MSPTPYFHVESLRDRFAHNLRNARDQGILDALELNWLLPLCASGAAVPDAADAPAVYTLLLEDGSPVPLDLASALLIVRRQQAAETLYLDTLAWGLERFTDRAALAERLKQRFAVLAGREPVFEYQALGRQVLEPRMLRIVDHQAQALSELSRELEHLPQWHDGPASTDLKHDVDSRLDDFWLAHDAHGVNRRTRFAQALADALTHHAFEAQHAGHSWAEALVQVGTRLLDTAAPVPISRLAVSVGGQGPFKLIGLYLIHLGTQGDVLYCPAKGLRYLSDWPALVALANSEAGRAEWQGYLSLDDQALWPATGGLEVQAYPLSEPLFLDSIDALVALQKRNLDQAFRRARREPQEQQAMLDDALDVRSLLDGRLPFIEGSRRWAAASSSFASTWSLPPSAQTQVPAAPHEPAAIWLEQVNRLVTQLAALDDRRPRLESLARQALSPWLAVLGAPEPLSAAQIEIDWVETGGDNHEDNHVGVLPAAPVVTAQRLGLIDLLLEQLSGARPGPLPTGSAAFGRSPAHDSWQPLAALNRPLLDHLLARAAWRLHDLCANSVEAFQARALRQGLAQTQPGQTYCTLRETLLRLELAVARRTESFPLLHTDWLQHVLDHPQATTRPVLGHAQVEARALILLADDRALPLAMAEAWVISLAGQPQQALLFWSSITGLQPLASMHALEQWLNRRMTPPVGRGRWLALLDEPDRRHLDEQLAAGHSFRLQLAPENGHFIRRMQHDEQQRQQQRVDNALQQARSHRLAAPLCRRYIDLAGEDRRLLVCLDNLAIRIQNKVLLAMLPPWLRSASMADMDVYADLLSRYGHDVDRNEDFLSGIASLHGFARQRLLVALARDFPGVALDPQRIIVTVTHYIAAPVPVGSIPSAIPAATQVDSESLVDFALNHFAHLQDASLSIGVPSDMTHPAGLTAGYVAALVHELDLGMQYRTLLAERLAPTDPHYPQRRERFIRQVPALLSLVALEMKMQGQLSPTAFDFIQCILEMPDSQARQPVHGCDIVLRPLTLVPRPDMAPDPAAGLYLIAPLDTRQGPVVLHALFNESFCFKEFRDLDDLLAQLRTVGPLQRLILDRVAPVVRKRYENDGLYEAHIPWSTESFSDVPLVRPAQVALGTEVLEGNALRHLFEATLQLLQDLSRKQSVSSAEADWASFVHVLALGIEQILAFVPGKLGILLAAWQSQALFRASASAVYERHWGEALSEFSAALGMLVTTRREEADPALHDPRREPALDFPEFSWRHSALTPELTQRLRPFEVHDIELSRLRRDALLNLYQDPVTARQYAAVAGQVYEVALQHNGWRITGRSGDGPAIRLDSHQQWELDLGQGLRGGGLPDRTDEHQELQDRIDELMIVQARGIAEIRSLSRDHARQINLARYQALAYLRNVLFNLNVPFAEGLSAPVQAVLRDFFGVPVPGMVLIDSLRARVSALFMALSEPSLSPLDSMRFVTGALQPGRETLAAFVIVGDPQARFFLGPMFFATPPYRLVEGQPGSRAFNPGDHFRAMALLHEISHLVLDTHDIAYLDASAPPLEQLDESLPALAHYKQRLQQLREYSLSHRTPPAQLFQVREAGGMRDLRVEDGPAFAAVLLLTGQPDLPAARREFFANPHARRRIILANADSLTMLVSLLGHQRWR